MPDHQHPSPAGLVLQGEAAEIVASSNTMRSLCAKIASLESALASERSARQAAEEARDRALAGQTFSTQRAMCANETIMEWMVKASEADARAQAAEDIAASEKASAASWCIRAQAAEAERERLLDAVYWALGEGDDFPPREAGDGAYWWRKDLRARAGNLPVRALASQQEGAG